MSKKLSPITPGEYLAEEFLEPLGVSQNRLARELFVTPTQINGIVGGKRRLGPKIALRLARYFGTTPQFWLNLQQHYDLELAQEEVGEEIERRIEPRKAA